MRRGTEAGGARPRWIDRVLDPSAYVVHKLQDSVVEPAWRRVTEGESRIPVSIAIVMAILLEATLATRVANRPRGLVAGVSAVLLVILIAVNPRRINRRSRAMRGLTLYAEDALRAEAVEDLTKRLNHARAKSTSPTPRASKITREPAPELDVPVLEALICQECGSSFDRVVTRGRKPFLCPGCRAVEQ